MLVALGREGFFLSSPVFSGKNSSFTNVKALWGQFGPTLCKRLKSKTPELNKIKIKVSSGVPEKDLRRATLHRFATPVLLDTPLNECLRS